MQKGVHEATGIRQGTLSGLANNLRTSWDIEILYKLLVYFEIEDIRDMIEYVSPKEVLERTGNLIPYDKDKILKGVVERYSKEDEEDETE